MEKSNLYLVFNKLQGITRLFLTWNLFLPFLSTSAKMFKFIYSNLFARNILLNKMILKVGQGDPQFSRSHL